MLDKSIMVQSKVKLIANSVAGIADATGYSVEDVLESLEEGTILDPEERDQVIEYLRSF